MHRYHHITPNDLATPFLLMLLAFWCGVFDVVHASGSYLYLRTVGNFGFSLIFGALGLLKFLSIYFNYPVCRRILLCFCIILWLSLSATILAANHASPATPACLYFAYQNILTWLRVNSYKQLCPN